MHPFAVSQLIRNSLMALFCIWFAACSVPPQQITRNKEAWEDSLTYANAKAMQSEFPNRITACRETASVKSSIGEDAADDPAIWVNKTNPKNSLILGTDKKAGLYVYDLQGEQKQFVDAGALNNVDLRDGFPYQGKRVTLIGASNRTKNAISLFVLDPETGIVSDAVANIPSGVDEVYGFCMYHNRVENRFFAIVNGKNGKIEQFMITTATDKIFGTLVKTLQTNSQPEGMVADDETGILYVGVEMEGIFYNNLTVSDKKLIHFPESTHKNKAVVYDIEGISLFTFQDEKFLIASIQGNFSYALFSITQKRYITSFVVDDGVVDGVEETDGLDITTLNLGTEFPNGILVLQDGYNTKNGEDEPQNFKIISTDKVLSLLKEIKN
jgi:3-phytase